MCVSFVVSMHQRVKDSKLKFLVQIFMRCMETLERIHVYLTKFINSKVIRKLRGHNFVVNHIKAVKNIYKIITTIISCFLFFASGN